MPTTARIGALGSRVGRRIFVFFAVAGILPIILTAYLSYDQTTSGLRDSVFASLRDDAKVHGMRILANLQERDNLTRTLLHEWREGELATTPETAAEVTKVFASVLYVGPSGNTETILGDGEFGINITDIDDTHLESGYSQLIPVAGSTNTEWALLLPAEPSSRDGGWLVFGLRSADVWAPVEYLPYQSNICVFAENGVPLTCTDGLPERNIRSLSDSIRSPVTSRATWTFEDREELAAGWQLFLDSVFASDSVIVLAVTEKEHAYRAVAGFQEIFPPAIGLVLLFVSGISFWLVRSSMIPLQKLTDVTKLYTSGYLHARVDVKTNDEFETLGQSFNVMATRLTAQIETLRAMSAIDRLIATAASVDEISETFVEYVPGIADYAFFGVITLDSHNQSLASFVWASGCKPIRTRLSLSPEHRVRLFQKYANAGWVERNLVWPNDESARDLPEFDFVWILPVKIQDAIKGAIIIGSPSTTPIPETTLNSLGDLATRLAFGIASSEREETLYQQAHFDQLTGLPNRQLLKDRVSQALQNAMHEGSAGALLFLDLDRFKKINDVFGHTIGDVILQQAGERIVREAGEGNTVARLGGDEFVVLVPNLPTEQYASDLAARLVDHLSEPFEIDGGEQLLGASIGIVQFPSDGESVEILLRNSDAAMYKAKDGGRSRYEYFSEKLNEFSRRKLLIERDLRRAIDTDTLELHFQPQCELRNNRIRGAEALLRWRHPELGAVSPNEFIAVAEDSDLIIEIGRWVINRACQELRYILDARQHPGIISINVSARQLRDPAFAGDIVGSLNKHKINPGFLELEITESVVAQNKETAVEALSRLRSLGIRIAMDDFGTGYSSLSYLQQLPFDCIKIDKSFVGSGKESQNICRAIITLAHQLGKEVIAEGVETEEQMRFMKLHRCDFVQGYLYSKPLPRSAFREFVRDQEEHTMRRKALEIG